MNEQGDLPLWIQQFPPQVIGIQLVSHLIRNLLLVKELGFLWLNGSDTKRIPVILVNKTFIVVGGIFWMSEGKDWTRSFL